MNKKVRNIIMASAAVVIVLLIVVIFVQRKSSDQKPQEIKVSLGDMMISVSTVGTVKPQNRLEIKPPINGRVERILVEEGQEVKAGTPLAFMSSIERATLLDAARLQGDSEFKYWQKAYKETPLVAPIDGVVIVRNVEPGQTVTSSEAIIVLSDRLIVEADVDETDIGQVKVGQDAFLGLDAYPDIKIAAVVDEISYESQIVNNVTIYKVDILPKEVPDVFRSGMSANVNIIESEVKNVLILPVEAIVYEDGKPFVKKLEGNSGIKQVPVTTGLENSGMVEIVSGVAEGDVVFAPKGSFVVPKKSNGTNPFLPKFKKKEEDKK